MKDVGQPTTSARSSKPQILCGCELVISPRHFLEVEKTAKANYGRRQQFLKRGKTAFTPARTGGDYLSKVAKHDWGARISKTASPPDVGNNGHRGSFRERRCEWCASRTAEFGSQGDG
jgi:hypothetical protein